MRRQRGGWWIFALVCAVAAAVRAQDSSPRIALDVTLRDDAGHAVSGQLQIVFALYAEEEGGSALYRETRTVDVVDSGQFTIQLGEVAKLDADLFSEHPELFLGVQVEDDKEAKPRMRLASAPFAITAEHAGDADTLAGIAPDELQKRIVGSCASGEAMVAVRSDGSVRCEPLPAGAAGARGETGPAGPVGPAGERGESGPILSFSCPGQAVSAVDEQGRPTCVPLASVNVRAGAGLTVDECAGDTCRLSVGPDAIGMAQVALPMGTEKVRHAQIFAGGAFFPSGASFTPDDDGSCLVLASIEVNETSTVSSGRLGMRVGFTEDGSAKAEPWSLVSYATPQASMVAVGSAAQQLVIPVAASKTYLFGCQVEASGSWVGLPFWCQVSYFCQ